MMTEPVSKAVVIFVGQLRAHRSNQVPQRWKGGFALGRY